MFKPKSKSSEMLDMVGVRWRMLRTQVALAVAPWLADKPCARHVVTVEGYLDTLMRHADDEDSAGNPQVATGVRVAVMGVDDMMRTSLMYSTTAPSGPTGDTGRDR